jgi:small subunit ribosomal protein S6
MAFYECVFITRQDITSAQVENLIEAYTKILEADGGQVASKEYWGLRTLAYKILKNRKGHYVLLNVEAPSSAVLEMERNMRINEDVIRYLTVKVDQLETDPSAMMQQRSGRDDRHFRRGGGGGGGGGRYGGGGGGRGGPSRGGPSRGGERPSGGTSPAPAKESEPAKAETEKGTPA